MEAKFGMRNRSCHSVSLAKALPTAARWAKLSGRKEWRDVFQSCFQTLCAFLAYLEYTRTPCCGFGNSDVKKCHIKWLLVFRAKEVETTIMILSSGPHRFSLLKGRCGQEVSHSIFLCFVSQSVIGENDVASTSRFVLRISWTKRAYASVWYLHVDCSYYPMEVFNGQFQLR